MIRLSGKCAAATVMIDTIDETTRSQILGFLDSPAFAGSNIVIMPDCHAGKGAVIGLTMTTNEFVLPNVVGVDIGCGMLAVRIGADRIDPAALDRFILREIPAGFAMNASILPGVDESFADEIEKTSVLVGAGVDRARRSLGSLGGGNHFIEVDREPGGRLWILVHSGSRNFGKCVAEHFQARARDWCSRLRGEGPVRDLEYLPADHADARAYLAAMRLAQAYARLNRTLIMSRILDFLGEARPTAIEDSPDLIESVHNYIDFGDNVVRKGAIAARAGQVCIIPFNMRDGAAICRGRGNPAFNQSAPHGAGRLLSRHAARRQLGVDGFLRSMSEAGVFTSTAGAGTIDEAPEAYKSARLILDSIGDSVEVLSLLKPLYNFKASGD